MATALSGGLTDSEESIMILTTMIFSYFVFGACDIEAQLQAPFDPQLPEHPLHPQHPPDFFCLYILLTAKANMAARNSETIKVPTTSHSSLSYRSVIVCSVYYHTQACENVNQNIRNRALCQSDKSGMQQSMQMCTDMQWLPVSIWQSSSLCELHR